MNQTPYPKNFETALKWDYKFWDTQPVAKLKETVAVEGEFPDVGINDKPDSLPEGFNWVNY
ncbi:MAG: hypothetical protein MUO21_07010, partial [Nitrososphaeraceae archaeon]|nr:hypothetical protein [Nitrososphaeraceae archaeon]